MWDFSQIRWMSLTTRTILEYWQWGFMCFTKTWLQEHIPSSNIVLLRLQTIREDRVLKRSRKSKGGEIVMLVNNRWCNPGHATLKHCFCSPDIELLAMSFCPVYLPREFTRVIVVAFTIILSCHRLELALRVTLSALLLLSHRHNNPACSWPSLVISTTFYVNVLCKCQRCIRPLCTTCSGQSRSQTSLSVQNCE